MTAPLWSLLGFAAWTLAVLMVGVGVRRWAMILSGRAALTDFPADIAHGSSAYRRAMRAHANCVENLPVFGVIIMCGHIAGMHGAFDAALAHMILAARVGQSVIHMAARETNVTVAVRFAFFLAQIAAMATLAARIVVAAG